MGIQIKTNVASVIAQRQLNINQVKLDGAQEKMSTGLRINKAADDAAGMAMSEGLRAKSRSLNMARRNASEATSMLEVAEGGMTEMGNILVRLRELSVQASSDTVNDRERSFLNREYTALVDELDRVANSTEYMGQLFFIEGDKSPESYHIQVGTEKSTPEENRDVLEVRLEGLRFNSESLGLGKENEIGPQEIGGDAPERGSIQEKIGVIDSAFTKLNEERGKIGALQNRIDSSINSLGISIENVDVAKSRILDADYAEVTANNVQQRILVQAGMSVLTQANQAPEMALALLR